MDAEVWSHADIRNGRWLFVALSGVILVDQALAIAGVFLGVPLAPLATGPNVSGMTSDPARFGATFVLSAVLTGIAASGRDWARYCLGAVATLMAAVTVWRCLPELMLAPKNLEEQVLIALAVFSALTVLGGFALMVLAPIRAFSWYRATKRSAIPVPMDDEPAHRKALSREVGS